MLLISPVLLLYIYLFIVGIIGVLTKSESKVNSLLLISYFDIASTFNNPKPLKDLVRTDKFLICLFSVLLILRLKAQQSVLTLLLYVMGGIISEVKCIRI